ncbi:thyroid stimulating hormone subunit beta a [Syngnathus typhle]|uniref:thyroid stimulating hormone subunit beta a n=1 Tax=Syngnathus typhle TaxID=161592 RepID=UPI002A6A6B1A|nr:thyroid stimulating hormone subunit beta a [Syngnathus typhle]
MSTNTVLLVHGEQDSNIRDLFGSRFLIQRGCTYDRVEYRTIQLPGCPDAASAAFTYPVALSCHCGACRTDTDECAHRADMGAIACTKPVRHMYPYLGDLMLS